MNNSQNMLVIASENDGIFVDLVNEIEIDLDEKFNIGCIKEIIYDEEDRVFYLLANKYD